MCDCQTTHPRKVITGWADERICVRRDCPYGTIREEYGSCVSCDTDGTFEPYNSGDCESVCRGKRQSYTREYGTVVCRKICESNEFYQYGCTSCDSLDGATDDIDYCTQHCDNRYRYIWNNGSSTYTGCALKNCPTGYFRTARFGSCVSCDSGLTDDISVWVSSESECAKCENDGAHTRTYSTSRYGGGYCNY